MKKFASRFFLVLICCMMCIIPLGSKPAKAAAVDASEIVYFQSVVQTGTAGSYAAITAVSQRYYKTEASLDSGENDIENSVGTKTSFTSVHEESICSMFSSDLAGLCDGGKLNGGLATLRMTKNGDITLSLNPKVKLGVLRIYYITAGRSGEAQLFCKDSSRTVVCEKAKTVFNKDNVNNKSNWKNYSKSGEMVYSATTIEGPFTKSVSSSGKTTYTEFNIFSQMNPTYEEYAENSGVYALISFSVVYEDVTYYVNDYTLDKKEFSTIGNMTNEGAEKQLIRINGPTQKFLQDSVLDVSKNAALLKVSSSLTPDGNSGFDTINSEFKGWMVPVIAIVIGIMFVVSGTMTGVTIVKSSDEPEVRRDAIKRLIGLFIGALVVYLILFFYEDIIRVVSGFFE